MATVSEPRRELDSATTGRRVRHPLQAVRGHIRRYVALEGLAIAVIYLALCFWAGLALDFGLFHLFAFDWIQELQQLTVDPATGAVGNIDRVIRVIMLCLLVGGLLALLVWKVVLRITREFSDAAVALVLERRFPSELGDRLITAVEMADPKIAQKYGYSQALIDNTIENAAQRVEKVPVRDAFNWARLRLLGLWSALLTVGMYVVVGIGSCIYGAATGASASPVDYFWAFNDTAGIWVERNVLLMDSYWPRQAYLEVIRFQDTKAHPGEMRVGRDEQRPDVQLRAVQWVVADRQSPDGWRALRWRDLPNYVDKQLVERVAIPEQWDQWLVDLDDLDPAVPHGILPQSWQGKTVGEVRREMVASGVGSVQALHDLLDWRSWSVDKIELQEKRGDIRRALRKEHPQAHQALQEIFGKLAELADSPRYSRTLRKLVIPRSIQVYYRGESRKSESPHELQPDNKYSVGLGDLKESVRFTARGEDYYTPYKRITLVPPPSIKALAVDKEEPAYLYYRVQGEQSALRGAKQLFNKYPVSVMGESSTIQVPLGANLVIHAETDRPLKAGIRMRAPAQTEERGAVVPSVPVVHADGASQFSISLMNVVRPYEFVLEFNDLDNVKGRRRIRIQPIDDRPPDVLDVELEVVLRKPRFKAETGRATPAADGFLITPDAVLPFKGSLRDDYGLTKAVWAYEVEQVEFELVGQGLGEKTEKLPTLVLQGSSKIRRAALIATLFQFTPGTGGMEIIVPAYRTWLNTILKADLEQKRTEGEDRIALEAFQRALEARSVTEVSLNELKQKLSEKPVGRPLLKEHLLKDEEGFDLRRYLPRLKSLDPRREAQLHYLVRLSVEATDNNVETGPSVGRNKAPFPFLVVSENELLGQIALEEEVLRDRLDKAAFKLRNGKTTLDEQVAKLTMTGSDYSLVSIRVDEVRKILLDGGTTTREVFNDYRRILKELEVNRIRKKTEDVREKIVFPLGEIIDPNTGNFATTELAVEKLYLTLEDDVNLKRGEDNRGLHIDNAKAAAQQLDRLLERLNEVLIAMDEGVVESKLLELLVNIERGVRRDAEILRFLHNRKVEELLKDLTK